MKYLVTASEMKRYDNHTIEKIGIPAMVLMERAALAVTEEVYRHCTDDIFCKKHVYVLTGVGNNGGDGLAVARLLSERGFRIDVQCVGDKEKASEQWKQQYEILKHYDVNFVQVPTREDYDFLVDALFGVGLSRDVTGVYREAIEKYNALDGFKIAVDIPSGIHSDNGTILGCAVKADVTVTFGFCKCGLVLYPGCLYAGEVKVTDIGIGERSFCGSAPAMFSYEEPAECLVPERNPAGNKGTFGKVLIVAGSVNMAGAAILSARAAYRTGAGMVKVITPAENRVIIQETVPEALLGTAEDLENSLEWADVIVIGPGLGKSSGARDVLKTVLEKGQTSLVIDADGLNLLAENPELKEDVKRMGASGRTILLTPHVGELARLVGKSVAECKNDLATEAFRLAEEIHAVVVAKDARTYVCAEGHPIYLNTSGNNGLATAGSGDVLAGICGALLAQNTDVFLAATVAVYLHGKAGDLVTIRMGEAPCMAGDLVEEIGKAWKQE